MPPGKLSVQHPEAQRSGHTPERLQRGGLVVAVDVGDDVPGALVGLQMLAEVSGAHRILHIHRNQPGVLAELNRELAAAGLNILGQHLKTDERTGYVITDVDRDYEPAALAALRGVAGTLRFRMLH